MLNLSDRLLKINVYMFLQLMTKGALGIQLVYVAGNVQGSK